METIFQLIIILQDTLKYITTKIKEQASQDIYNFFFTIFLVTTPSSQQRIKDKIYKNCLFCMKL